MEFSHGALSTTIFIRIHFTYRKDLTKIWGRRLPSFHTKSVNGPIYLWWVSRKKIYERWNRFVQKTHMCNVCTIKSVLIEISVGQSKDCNGSCKIIWLFRGTYIRDFIVQLYANEDKIIVYVHLAIMIVWARWINLLPFWKLTRAKWYLHASE